jgi:hypothetical protein
MSMMKTAKNNSHSCHPFGTSLWNDLTSYRPVRCKGFLTSSLFCSCLTNGLQLQPWKRMGHRGILCWDNKPLKLLPSLSIICSYRDPFVLFGISWKSMDLDCTHHKRTKWCENYNQKKGYGKESRLFFQNKTNNIIKTITIDF